MSAKFRINRYNWFAQKLLAQHQHQEIVVLHEYLISSQNVARFNVQQDEGEEEEADNSNNKRSKQQLDEQVRRRSIISEHLCFINALAQLKTSHTSIGRLEEVIFSLQRLNFDTNSQHLLLLCQCLLYSGQSDSVVVLCKTVINSQASNLANSLVAPSFDGPNDIDCEFSKTDQDAQNLLLHDDESFEFEKAIANVNTNQLINDARFWFIFGLSLEFQAQLKDAHFAYKVSAHLNAQPDKSFSAHINNQSACCNLTNNTCYDSVVKYTESCVKQRRDYKSPIQLLLKVNSRIPQNYTLNPHLALLISCQAAANQSSFTKSREILYSLENYSSSNRNPSSGYNKFALKCKKKMLHTKSEQLHQLETKEILSSLNDENRFCNLDYLLIKSHIAFNSIVQDSAHVSSFFSSSKADTSSQMSTEQLAQIDKSIESLRFSSVACWSSGSLWNNLGIYYLLKRRFIASLSCLMRAHQLNRTNWRINYNLALACLHVGLFTRALVCLTAAKNFYPNIGRKIAKGQQKEGNNANLYPFITTLLAICYEASSELNEARRFHLMSTQKTVVGKSRLVSVPIFSLVNYLIFLHKFQNSEQIFKLKLHLLDQLEQLWLQRNQNDAQFNIHLLEVAQLIGNQTISNENNLKRPRNMTKTYAWTKSLTSNDNNGLALDS